MSANVYRLYDGDDFLIYIGCSNNPAKRIVKHRREQPWGSEIVRTAVTPYPSQFEARQAERRAIFDEQPRYNVRHKTTDLTYRVAAALAQPETSEDHVLSVITNALAVGRSAS